MRANTMEETMRLRILVPSLAAALFGCAAAVYADEAMQIPVNTGNTPAGDGHTVMFKGSQLPLTGTAIKVGDRLPTAILPVQGWPQSTSPTIKTRCELSMSCHRWTRRPVTPKRTNW